MSAFLDKLNFRNAGYHGGSLLLRLTNWLRYQSSLGLVTVPKNFITDGASVPRCFWNVFPPFGDYFPAAVVHDFLYSPLNEEFTRDEADFIFLEAMHAVGVPWYRRHVIHAAVRAFGWTAFKGKQK